MNWIAVILYSLLISPKTFLTTYIVVFDTLIANKNFKFEQQAQPVIILKLITLY